MGYPLLGEFAGIVARRFPNAGDVDLVESWSAGIGWGFDNGWPRSLWPRSLFSANSRCGGPQSNLSETRCAGFVSRGTRICTELSTNDRRIDDRTWRPVSYARIAANSEVGWCTDF
jgi:hypothetical protein